MNKKILVIGASGNVGRPLVKKLLSAGAQVKAASRSGKAIEGADGVAFDFSSPESFPEISAGVDSVYLMIPTGATGAEKILKPLIEHCARKGIHAVLHTALEVQAYPGHAYAAAEELIKSAGGPHSIVRPSWYMENFDMFWNANIKAGSLTIPAGEGKMSLVAVDDIAASAAAVLLSDSSIGKAFNITGPEALSFGDALSIISKHLDKPVVYNAITSEESIQNQMKRGISREEAEFFDTAYTNVRNGYASLVTDDVQTLTGTPPQTFDAFIQANKGVFL